MLCCIIKPVLVFMHSFHKVFIFILNVAIYAGRTLFLILIKSGEFIREVFAALAIIAEELYYFLCDLYESASAVSLYVRTSANGGVNGIIEAIVVFCRHMRKFFLNTQIISKLVATKLGCFVCHFLDLVRNALLLITDCAWWLITLIPRYLLYSAIAVGDAIVGGITLMRKAVVYSITIVVEDIFRLTIGIVLLILLWHNRRRLARVAIRFVSNLKRIIVLCFHRLCLFTNWILGRRTRLSVVRTTPTRSRLPRQRVSPAASEKSIDPHQRCVVCRDRQKCVVLLPCKHLCLCEECADYMIFSAQRQTCPLCRTSIVHSMSVYT
uniref:RING-type domain-containing protein n=1 Tax=Stomoxys calcitrans TaxID=35570 RepID=A0A1I8Q0P1_STOCA